MGNSDDAHMQPGGGGGGGGSQSSTSGKDGEQEPVLLASLRQPTGGAKVHALPCTIAHDGPAAVGTFFMPKRAEAAPAVPGTAAAAGKAKGNGNDDEGGEEEQEQEGQAYEAQFRGRCLKGVKVSCPPGMVGFVARETVLPPELAEQAPSEGANRYWALESEFRQVTLWQHDFAPPLDHCFHRVAEWCALAKAIHDDDDDDDDDEQGKTEAMAS